MPSNKWSDLIHHAHDRSFVIAGVTKDAMLADFHKAIVDAATSMPFKGYYDRNNQYHEGFLDRFDEIVKRYGWDYNGGRNWRARVIYETNLKSAYAAGRYRQMNEPAVKKAFPYWEYLHGVERVPTTPRKEHVRYNGLILRADDPWWNYYYPPNGWKCSCGVRPVSRAELKRLGKDGPDPSPDIVRVPELDPATGEEIAYPEGIDMGWAYAPGKSLVDGLIPRQLQRPLNIGSALKGKDPLSGKPLPELFSKPLKSSLLPKGLEAEEYATAFMKEFGGSIGDDIIYRDKAGHALIVSDHLFRRADGRWKIDQQRSAEMLLLAEALKDPDEIWVDFADDEQIGASLVRKYLKYDPNTNAFILFNWTWKGWEGATAFSPKTKRALKPKPDYLEKFRRGALLYRRPEK